MGFENLQLKDVCSYSAERIEVARIDVGNYISTENLLPDKMGKVEASGLPKAKTVIKYEPGDTLISNIRPYFRKIWYSDTDGGASADVLVFKPNLNKVNNKYLYYYLSQNEIFDYMVQTSKGTKMPRGDKSALMNYEVNLPQLEVQKKVAGFLSSLDDKIAINKKQILSLEELAQTLFKHWFVDFEFPNENGEPYKSSGGEMVESELGMIPQGWYTTELDKIISHSKSSFNPKKVDSVEVAHFSLPAFDQQVYPVIENSGTIKSNKYYIDNDSIMFSRMNPNTPRVWMPTIIDGLQNICSTEFVVMDTSKNKNKSFVYALANSQSFTNYLINNATGSTNSRQRVRPAVALSYKFAYEKTIANKYTELVKPFHNKLLVLRGENKKLESLRDTLLPKLLSGEIELPEDEEVIL